MSNDLLDIDFVMFGPFNSLQSAKQSCGNLVNNSIYDGDTCSFSMDSKEHFRLKNAVKGQVYILVLSVYGNGLNKSGLKRKVKFVANTNKFKNLFEIADADCDYQCDGCTQNTYNCLKCYESRQLDYRTFQKTGIKSTSCKCSQKGQFNVEGQRSCGTCSPKCSTCNSTANNCTECSEARKQIKGIQTPLCDCPISKGYFEYGLTCQKCSVKCLTCQSLINCYSCSGIRIQPPLCKCPENFYSNNEETSCLPCGPLGSCSNSETNYISCFKLLNRVLQNNECVAKPGYVDIGLPEAVQCSKMCQTCVQSPTNCTECKGKTRVQAPPTCPCKSEQYSYNNDKKECMKIVCHYSCQTCRGDSNKDCLSCGSSLRRLQNNQCICNSGFFENPSSQKCEPCYHQCKTCTNEGQSNCSSCFKLMQLKQGHCECIKGYYFAHKQCNKCYHGCSYCLNGESCVECLEKNRDLQKFCVCKKGFFENEQGKCQKCSQTCKTCQKNKKIHECTSCRDSDYRIIQQLNNQQICGCRNGYFSVNASSVCQKCDYQCESCVKKGSNCTKCTGIRINEPDCTCPKGKYSDQRGKCQSCSIKCLECVENPNNCTTCGIYRKNPPLCSCIEGHFEKNNFCRTCSKHCQQCTSLDKCLKCSEGLHMIYSKFSSTCGCLDGYFYFLNQCNTCDKSCSLCTSKQTCQKCNPGFYLHQNQCKSCHKKCQTCTSEFSCEICQDEKAMEPQCICPLGTYMDINFACKTCLKGCESCTSKSQCNSCFDKFYLKQNKCIPCQGTCQTCVSKTTCKTCNLAIAKAPLCIESCNKGYFLNNSGYCQICSNNCLHCKGEHQCVNCSKGFFLQNGDCSKCGLNCIDCTENLDNCTTCKLTDKGQTPPLCIQVQQCAVVYSECNFLGKEMKFCDNEPDLQKSFNLNIKSIKVPNNSTVQLFLGTNYQDKSFLVNQDQPCLQAHQYTFIQKKQQNMEVQFIQDEEKEYLESLLQIENSMNISTN